MALCVNRRNASFGETSATDSNLPIAVNRRAGPSYARTRFGTSNVEAGHGDICSVAIGCLDMVGGLL
jgi:hypothetical protein